MHLLSLNSEADVMGDCKITESVCWQVASNTMHFYLFQAFLNPTNELQTLKK